VELVIRGRALGAVCLDPPVDDRQSVDAILAGDRDAYRVLVERESPDVFRMCYRILGDLTEAEDAAQETFVTAYRALASFRAEGSFGAWIGRIAARLSYRRLAMRRRASTEPIDETYDVAAPTSMTDPLRLALGAERDASVRRAVADLGEPYREVVALRFFGELSLNEIAAATDRPLGTVKTHLHRGLERLRRTLGSEVPV
jgi:RNA polymerase sigma-70 factor (ECF subfamily)